MNENDNDKKMSDNGMNSDLTENEAQIADNSAKKPKKNKIRSTVFTIVEVICLAVFAVAAYYLISYGVDLYKEKIADEEQDKSSLSSDGNDNSHSVSNGTIIGTPGSDATDSSGTVSSDGDDPVTPVPSDATEPKEDRTDPVLNTLRFYTKRDITKLKQTNSDVYGWIYFQGVHFTEIDDVDQVLVQRENDNFYYLSKDWKQQDSAHGTIYFDYRNNAESILENRHLILYGHAASYNKLGSIKDLNALPEWYNNEEYHFIYIQTETETTVWRIFSWSEQDEDYDYRETFFESNKAFVDYCTRLQDDNKISALKQYKFNSDDIILTLSTCKGTNARNRAVVHAILVAYAKTEDLD